MRNRRHRTLVESFQHKLIVRMISYWFIYQLALWNFLFCWRLLSDGKGDFFAQFNLFLRESSPMLICFAVLVPAFAWDAVRSYHRIARPIGLFRQIARDIAEDRPVRPVRLQDGDELQGMKDDFNAMLDALASRGALTMAEDKRMTQDLPARADASLASASALEE